MSSFTHKWYLSPLFLLLSPFSPRQIKLTNKNYITKQNNCHNKLVSNWCQQEGDRIPRRGYWGDILVSPYITFGIESDKKEFFKKGNNEFIYVSVFIGSI